VPGAEEDWKKVKAILKEMKRKYKETTPFYPMYPQHGKKG
jgi:hypothetical protein